MLNDYVEINNGRIQYRFQIDLFIDNSTSQIISQVIINVQNI
jgi:hypothetical protein